VPAPIVLWTSCGSFRLATNGRVWRLPPHWLVLHGGGTGRRFGAQLNVRRNHAGRFLLLLHGRLVWRSHDLYPRDGGDVAFGRHEFAFASYRRGVYLTDLRGGERLVARGRGLGLVDFTRAGDLIVVGGRSITFLSRQGVILRRFRYRLRNGYSFDEPTDTLYFVTSAGRLAAARETRVRLGRKLTGVDGTLSLAQPGLLVFSAAHGITVTGRDGTLVARASWRSRRLGLDSGVSVSLDGRAFAFRLTDAHPGSRSGTAAIYVLRAGATRAHLIYRHRLGPSGCAVGAGLGWHGRYLLYDSSDGHLDIIDSKTGAVRHLTRLARGLPHHGASERALATWRSDIHR
jgi:hypothetical protein